MADANSFDKIELYLVRLFHTVITERSISRAALRLQTTQPAVSAKLKRLRTLTGDPLLVRAGHGMVPTPAALALMAPAADILRNAQLMFGSRTRGLDFDPAHATLDFRVAASDWLDPMVMPELVGRVKAQAPGVGLQILSMTGDYDYRQHLAHADVDLVIGNWMRPPEELHMAPLFDDEVVCLVAADHPAVRNPGWWTPERYLESEHVAPQPPHAASPGIIDEVLASRGLARNITVRTPHYAQAPLMVARSHLVLTTGRRFCSRYVDVMPVCIVPAPVRFPPLTYYQLWHELNHHAGAGRWLREQLRQVMHALAKPE